MQCRNGVKMQNQTQKYSEKKPCALYIHIPFCIRKCLYCDFLSLAAGNEWKEQYIQALLRELESWKEMLQNYCIHSIFVGGGTPTCLLPEQMAQFVRGLSRMLSGLTVETSLEFTMEANPGTIQREHLPLLKEAGVNRISLGLQSAHDRELQALGRIHTYEDFLRTYDMVRTNEFSNVNIDLMCDIPLQTIDSWENTLEQVVSLTPEHISAYSLIIEEGTPFFSMAERGVLEIPSEEMDRQMYCQTEKVLGEAGYHRYEISNYARPGYECLHNLTYWDTREYLGVGLGASSCLRGYRFHNTGDMKEYLSYFDKIVDFKNRKFFSHRTEEPSLSDRGVLKEVSRWTDKDRKEEFMFLGLRKMAGISLADFQQRFGESLWQVYGEVLPRLLQQKLLAESGDGERIFLTRRGIDVSNLVLAEFLLE